MIRSALRMFPALLILPVAIAFNTQIAHAEPSLIELRQENERLREQVAELDARLAEARRRIARLEEIIRELRRQMDELDAPDPIPSPGDERVIEAEPEMQERIAEEKIVIPDDPLAAPDALLAALEKEYEDVLAHLPDNTEREAQQFLIEARRWARQASFRHRGQVEWMVRILDAAPTDGRDTEFTIQVIDGETGTEWGRPFRILIGGRDAGRLQADPARSMWMMGGVFAAQPVVNPDRRAPAIFDATQLIGPYIEFHYSFTIKSLRPLDREEIPGAASEEPDR